MKKNFFCLFIALFYGIVGCSQNLKHDSWSYEVSKARVRVGETVELIFKVTIDNNWYMYSSDFSPEVGPTVTAFKFEKHPSYQLVGKLQAIKPKKKYDEIFEGDIKYFAGTAHYRQKIKILSKNILIKGRADYQICSETNGQCVPGSTTFTYNKTLIKVAR